jgi:hypothetical protein
VALQHSLHPSLGATLQHSRYKRTQNLVISSKLGQHGQLADAASLHEQWYKHHDHTHIYRMLIVSRQIFTYSNESHIPFHKNLCLLVVGELRVAVALLCLYLSHNHANREELADSSECLHHGVRAAAGRLCYLPDCACQLQQHQQRWTGTPYYCSRINCYLYKQQR